MKKFLWIALFAFALSQFAQKQTDSFTLSKIGTLFLKEKSISIDDSLLSQPFSYLGKGGQSYVFVSDDGKYILKCFRSSRLHILEKLSSIFPFLNKKKHKLESAFKNTLKSYFLAFEKLREETGLIAIHLNNQIPISTSLMLIDKLGICHTIDPNTIPFVIQKKAIAVKEKIARDPNPKHLKALFLLFQSRIGKGIEDEDPNISKNFGFVNDSIIEIDGGRFSLSSSPSLDPIAKSKEDFQHWLNANFPELSQEFQTFYEEFCREVF